MATANDKQERTTALRGFELRGGGPSLGKRWNPRPTRWKGSISAGQKCAGWV